MNDPYLMHPINVQIPSNNIKEVILLETNSLTCHSEPNKLDISIAQSQIPISTDENSLFNNDSDNDDSFDDEDEIIPSDTSYSTIPPVLSTYGLTPCPICLEPSILELTSCCKFHCCHNCWHRHISNAINDGRIQISCASNECSKYLSRDIILDFIRHDSILYERYSKLYANINQNPRAKTCPRCSHLYSLDKNKPIILKSSKKSIKKIPKQVQCSECSFVWCFRCSAPWHENLTCKQFLKGDKLLLKWINQKYDDQWNARKCPKCSSIIQRVGGCPHMTCSSCSCEFCYLCGRRYCKIPIIGQHNNKFSMLGCPYNLHPEKPWLRRTIRGVIATGVVVASPIIVAGALTAAVTVLPTVGVYKLVKHVRDRRQARIGREFLNSLNRREQQEQELLPFDLHDDEIDTEQNLRFLRQSDELNTNQTNEENFPLEIFVDMDVENLFSDDIKLTSDFQTCPTTPAIDIKNHHDENINNLIIRPQHLIAEEHE